MAFENLVGNEKVKKLLLSIIEQQKTTHSYLFLGPSGVGKTLFAKEFAKMILCMEEKTACGHCKSCLQFEEHNQPDFILLEPEEGKIKIEQIRRNASKNIRKANYFFEKSICH